jgi:molecular chaperone DnaJ
MAEKRDYYDVLELPKDASTEDVKKAFRRLALQFHPDRNKDEDASGRFREVSEAYQVLSDPERRAAYDRFGHSVTNGDAGRGFDGYETFGGFGDIFEAFFGGSSARGPRQGRDLEHQVSLKFTEAAFGVARTFEVDRSELCDRCGGSRAEPGTEQPQCSTCGGQGKVRRVSRSIFGQFQQIATCSACGGAGKLIKVLCTQCKGRGAQQRRRRLSVDVPAGIEDGARILLRGQGEPGEPGGRSGDLYVAVSVEPHPVFERDGNDVRIMADLNMAQAALGSEIEVPTLEGTEKLKFRAGVQSGEEMRLRGKGIPQLGGGRRGDLIVTLRVNTPTSLTSQQRKLLEELSASFDGSNGRNGIFGKLKDALAGDERPQ